MFLLELKLYFDSKVSAKNFFDLIKPKLRGDFSQSVVKVSQANETLVFEITAGEKKDLGVVLNLVLKSVQVFEGVVEV
jgi:tRNA threonylcarbamoyladenosine modification (KEOPS) complex  Pcc1 subunit